MTSVVLAAVLLWLAAPALAAPKTVVFFQTWSARLDDAAKAAITGAARAARAAPQAVVKVIGAADTEGSAEANRLLSRLRAQVVKDALVADGIAAGRIHIHGIGAVPSEQTQQESRRVTISVGH